MLHDALELRDEGSIHGKGLFATRPIAVGEVIWRREPDMPTYTLAEVLAWPPEKREAFLWYAFQCDAETLIYTTGPDGHMNHSCDPNTWWGDDETLVARYPIAADEEVTYDYATTEISLDYRMVCHCGAPNCRRTITNRDHLNPDWQRQYAGHLPSFVVKASNTMLNDVYRRAQYYDIIFNRDLSEQVDFCLAAFQHFVGRAPLSVLDVACGPGYHAQALARHGLTAFGLDLSTAMLELGRQQSDAVHFIEANMCDFTLPQPVDLAVCMFDGLELLISSEAAIDHLRALARNLNPGGLYITEQTHPRLGHVYEQGPMTWEAERDGVQVSFTWGANHPVADIASGVAEIEIELRVVENGAETVFRDRTVERAMQTQELKVLAEHVVGGLRVVGYYGNFDLNQPLDWSPGSQYLITVLQKTL